MNNGGHELAGRKTKNFQVHCQPSYCSGVTTGGGVRPARKVVNEDMTRDVPATSDGGIHSNSIQVLT